MEVGMRKGCHPQALDGSYALGWCIHSPQLGKVDLPLSAPQPPYWQIYKWADWAEQTWPGGGTGAQEVWLEMSCCPRPDEYTPRECGPGMLSAMGGLMCRDRQCPHMWSSKDSPTELPEAHGL